jgi:hypothetical protein
MQKEHVVFQHLQIVNEGGVGCAKHHAAQSDAQVQEDCGMLRNECMKELKCGVYSSGKVERRVCVLARRLLCLLASYRCIADAIGDLLPPSSLSRGVSALDFSATCFRAANFKQRMQ